MAAPALSAAEGFAAAPAVEGSMAVEGSTEVAADFTAVGEADTARITMSRLCARHTELIPGGCADSAFRADFCDGFRSYTG